MLLSSASPPQSNLGRVSRNPPPHVGECAVPRHVLAVQCATLWNHCGTLQRITEHRGMLWEHYRMLRKHYGTELFWSIMEHYRSITECCRALWNVTGALSYLNFYILSQPWFCIFFFYHFLVVIVICFMILQQQLHGTE